MTKLYLSLFLASVLCSCASNPDNISTAYVSPLQYAAYDCNQLSQEMGFVNQRTNALYQSLEQKRNADNWQMGVGLLLFWPTLFALEGGDGPEAAEYAQLKGEFEALRENSIEKNCNIALLSPDEILDAARQADANHGDNQSTSEISTRLSELDQLKEQGAITEDEYQAARKRALGI